MNEELLEALAADAEPEEQDGEAPPSVVALGQELYELRMTIQGAEGDLKDLKARKGELATELLPDSMKAAGLVGDNGNGSFTLAGGGKVYLKGETYVSYTKANKEALFVWLRANGHGELIQPNVHPQTLKAFVKEQRANGVKLPEDLLSIYDVTVAVAAKS